MNTGLKNAAVAVTASTSGIGLAIAKEFLMEGANIMINGRDSSKLLACKNKLNEEFPKQSLWTCNGDMSLQETITDAKEICYTGMQHLDVLVCNLGSGKPRTQDLLDIDEWQRILNINLLSTVRMIRTMKPLLKGGNIVIVSSIAGMERSHAPLSYAVAKAGLNVLVKGLSDALAMDGIRINAVAPGNIYFEGGRWEELRNLDSEHVADMLKKEVPLNRFGLPEEVAKAVVFLGSKLSSFTTGSVLTVDGGQTRKFG